MFRLGKEEVRVNGDVEDFLSDLEVDGCKNKTIRDYRMVLNKFFEDCGKSGAAAVSVGDMRGFLKKTKKRLSHNTYFIYFWKLRKFFKDRNEKVYKYLKKFHVSIKDTDVEPFTKREIEMLARFFANKAEVYAIAFLLLVETGLRVGELCGLLVEDLLDDEEDCTLVNVRVWASRSKTGKYRLVPFSVTSSAYRRLTKYLGCRRAEQKDFLLLNLHDKPLSPNRVARYFQAAKKILRIEKKCTPHVCRHTFATACREAGVDKETVKAWLGHSKNSPMLDRIYDHPTKSRIRKARKMVQIT